MIKNFIFILYNLYKYILKIITYIILINRKYLKLNIRLKILKYIKNMKSIIKII